MEKIFDELIKSNTIEELEDKAKKLGFTREISVKEELENNFHKFKKSGKYYKKGDCISCVTYDINNKQCIVIDLALLNIKHKEQIKIMKIEDIKIKINEKGIEID